jgi:hypothetical protein
MQPADLRSSHRIGDDEDGGARMSRLTVGLCAGIVTVALLAGCGPDRPSRPGGGTASPTTAARPTRPPDNGIAAKPVKEILAATERAFRSARSVQVKVTFKDRAGVVKANLTLTHKQDLAAGWFEQQGARMSFRVAGGRSYFRGRRFWAKQGNAELAKLIGDRWVLVPRSVAGELTPLGDDFTIDGLADELFRSKDRPRFIRKGRATVGRLPAVRLWSVEGSYYVAATGKPYPLLLDHAGDNLDTAFSNYDRNVPILAPRGALDLEELRG